MGLGEELCTPSLTLAITQYARHDMCICTHPVQLVHDTQHELANTLHAPCLHIHCSFNRNT